MAGICYNPYMFDFNDAITFNPLTRERHGAIHEVIADLCAKMNMEVPKLLRMNEPTSSTIEEAFKAFPFQEPKQIVKRNHLPPLLEKSPLTFLYNGKEKGIIFNQPLLEKILGNEINYAEHASISEELKGAVVHELAHIKRGDHLWTGALRKAQFTQLACIAGALTGLYIIRSFAAKSKDKPADQQLPSQQETEEMLKLPEHVKSPTLEAAKTVAFYTVAAVAGWAVGRVAASKILQHMEHSCDAMSKEVMGSGKPLASFLQKANVCMENEVREMLQKKQVPEQWHKSLMAWNKTINNLIGIHPSFESRVDRLSR